MARFGRHLVITLALLGAAICVSVALDGADGGGGPRPGLTVESRAPGAEPVELGPGGAEVLEALRADPPPDARGAATDDVRGLSEDEEAAATAWNDRAVRDGTYDASGIVLGAAGAPARITCLTHQHGAPRTVSRIGLGVVHTTEGPNVRGLADVDGLCAWFRQQKLSATWIVDDEGNSAKVLELTQTPWTQAAWNPWSCSIEFVGYAARPVAQWTDAQLREGARLMAQCFKAAGVPIRWGAVAGTAAGSAPRILTTGVIAHAELGYNGGSHHDPGAAFPRARFLELMRAAAGGRDGEPSLAALTAGEARAAQSLLAARRVAKRHGGWRQVHPSHLRRASAAKAALRRANLRLHAAAGPAGDWIRNRRAERHDVIHALL